MFLQIIAWFGLCNQGLQAINYFQWVRNNLISRKEESISPYFGKRKKKQKNHMEIGTISIEMSQLPLSRNSNEYVRLTFRVAYTQSMLLPLAKSVEIE